MKARNYKSELAEAVAYFWKKRTEQSEKQGEASGTKDAGNRSSVTGGAQLDAFVELFAKIARDSGLTDSEIHMKETTLPGYYRPTKEWDLVLYADGDLIASVEFKSHIGPSFGNNFNNRVEEALGSATDLRTAYREGAMKQSIKPWMGYFMLLEDHPKSATPVKVREPYFPVLPDFKEASYQRRYVEFCRRLVLEGLYDSACLLFSAESTGRSGDFIEPSTGLDFIQFSASFIGAITAFIQNRDMRR